MNLAMLMKFVGFVLGLALCLAMATAVDASPIPIQTSVGSRNDSLADTSASQANDGRVIDSIVIETRNIYDTSDPRYSSFLFRTANRLHVVTRARVVRREVLFQQGDRFSSEIAEETARNLRARYYLYDAWVESERLPNGHVRVRIVTVDQWSLVGGFNINREGNRTKYKIGFEERNLIGMNQFISFDYMVQEKDRNYVKWVFRDTRFFGFPYMVTTEFNTDPRNEVLTFAFSHPFYNLDQRFSYGFMAGSQGGRRVVYADADSVGAWRSHADEFDMSAEYRWGSRYEKLALTSGYSYHRDNITDRQGAVVFPIDSLYHEPSLGLAFYRNRYVRLRRIAGFSYLEDFTLTTGVAGKIARAFTTTGGSYYNRFSAEATFARQLDSSLLFLSYGRSYWVHGGDLLRRTGEFVGRYYNTSFDWLTLASRFIYRSDVSILPNHGLILGGIGGLRGYDEISRTGDRLAVLNLESRFYPNIEFLSVIFGGVIFADMGRTWVRGEPIHLNDVEYSVGAGLRISLEKATKSELIRVDAAVTRYGNWGIAFGTGQYF